MGDTPSNTDRSATTLRNARRDDVDALAAVKVEGWHTTYADLVDEQTLAPFLDVAVQRAAVRALLDDSSMLVVVAEHEGTVVAFGTGDLRTGYVDTLHVLPAHRSRGIGRRLLGAIAEAARQRGCTKVSLHVVAGNIRARQFYERLGGELTGSGPADWAPTVDEVHYRWTDIDRLVHIAAG
jgi:ribosomal protein S18 acetylase RimI-like enzyme